MQLEQLLNPWFQDSKEYPAGKTFEYVMEKYGFKRADILRLAGNETTVGISPKAIEAAKEAIFGANFYDEPNSESLVNALEQHFANNGLDLTKSGIVVGNGMDNVIDHIFMLFANSNSSILNSPPTFTYYKFSAKRFGIEVLESPRDLVKQGDSLSYQINFEAIKKSIKTNTKIVFLCSPNNPDGGVIEASKIEDLAKYLLAKNIILFVDHAYIDFCDRSKYDVAKLVALYPNLVVGYTFSKAYALAGFRVGYAVVSKELQKQYFKHMTPFLCSRPSIAAAKAALNDQEHLKKIITTIQEQRVKLAFEYKQLGFDFCESFANFYLIQPSATLLKTMPQDSVADCLLEKLMSKGIIVRAMPVINSNSLRVTIGTAEENQRLIKSLKEIL